MARAAVVNASPLIYLTEVAQLELLRLAGDEILVPGAVADEARRWGDDDLAGRRCAVVHHVNVRGCLGLVLVAKQRRLSSTTPGSPRDLTNSIDIQPHICVKY